MSITVFVSLTLITITSLIQTKTKLSYKPEQTFRDCNDCRWIVVMPDLEEAVSIFVDVFVRQANYHK